MVMKGTGKLGRTLIGAGVALGLASSASAATISGLSIFNGSTFTLTGSTSDRAATNGTQTVSSTSTSFQTRYWTTGTADRGVAFSGGTATAQTNVNYTINFSVTHALGVPYQIDVATSLLAGLTAKDDAAGAAAAGSASIGLITGSKTGGGGTLTGTLGLSGTSSIGGTSSTSGSDTNVTRGTLATPSATIFAIGTGAAQAYALTFTFTAAASAVQNGLGSDEEAYRIGLGTATGSGLLPGANAADYAGVASRNGLADGHFVKVSITPEPGALVLVASGLAGLAVYGRRKTA